MAEAVIWSIASELTANLVPRLLGQVGNLWGVKQEVQSLEEVVNMLSAVLIDAQDRYHQNSNIQGWVGDLKEAFYDAQDVLEEFNIEATRRELRSRNGMIKEVRTLFSSSNQLAFKWKMSSKIRAVRKRMTVLGTGRETFSLNECPERERRKREETHSFVNEGNIIGRYVDKETIKRFLLDSSVKEDVSIITIFGIGGLGKTTLAQYVYNDRMVSEQFNLKMWVAVSNHYDIKTIVKNIIACATNKRPTEVAMELLKCELRARIDGKKFLLVLDDLWDVSFEDWLPLKSLLMGGAGGSKILITTRICSVAETIGTTVYYNLKGLHDDASLDLLLQIACPNEDEMRNPATLGIAREIAKKCSGVPLVIRTIGNLLFYKEAHSWSDFLAKELPEVALREDKIMSVLRLSYDHLPSHLKQCFAFCSLFPKDYEINKQTLINLWVAEGFIQPSDGTQHLEDIADEYFMDLFHSNFFQDFQKDPFKNKVTCKMPALMHDLACSVAGSECWKAGDGSNSTPKRTRHISHGLTSDLMGELSKILRLKASSLRTILAMPTYREMEQRKLTSEADLCQLIQNFRRLRVFDLHAAIFKKVPRSFCKLKYLTYLDLSHNNELKRLPNSITRLHNLQTLNLQGCSSLEELPRDMRKLVNLRNLDIDYCYSLSYIPRGLEQLCSLHSLTRFILPRGKALTKNYCGLGELHNLNDLSGSLSIENLVHSGDALEEYNAANLEKKYRLESLILKWGYLDTDDAVIRNADEDPLDRLRPHKKLEKLTIDGYGGESFPNWMMVNLVSILPNLVELRLIRCGRCKHLPQLGQLLHLKSLEIWWLTELEDIESDHFDSDRSPSWTSIPSLLKLEIRYCKNLKTMAQTPNLEELNVREVNLKFFDWMIGLKKLKSLDISQIESLQCLPEEWLRGLTSLERLDISECPQLTSLSGMRHLPNLARLSFSNCGELDLSKGESDNISNWQGLERLRFVDIHGVPKLASLPQWLLQVKNLQHLSIKKCINLKALPEKIEDLQSLQQLEIIRCPLLTSLPNGIRKLTSLSHLKIAGCPDLEERCNVASEDRDKIAHIKYVTHKLEYYERHL